MKKKGKKRNVKKQGLFQWDRKFEANPGHYIVQSLVATVYIIIVLVALDLITQTAIIATLGASAFIIFVRPHSYISRTRILLGGYIIAMVVGVSMSLLANMEIMETVFVYHEFQFVFFSAAAVGIVIPALALTNTEHPPAASMALGLVLSDWNIVILLFIISCVLFLAVVKKGFSPVMMNLM